MKISESNKERILNELSELNKAVEDVESSLTLSSEFYMRNLNIAVAKIKQCIRRLDEVKADISHEEMLSKTPDLPGLNNE